MKKVFWVGFVSLLSAWAVADSAHSPTLDYRHPRPSGYNEPDAPPKPQKIDFVAPAKNAGIDYDFTAQFSKNAVPEFEVTRVTVNGAEMPSFVVSNNGIANQNHRVFGIEDFTVSVLAHWKPGQEYRVEVEGLADKGKPVKLSQAQTAPAEPPAATSISFQTPTADDPYHFATLTVAAEAVVPGVVKSVEVDGKPNRDARYYNDVPAKPEEKRAPGGESYEGKVLGGGSFRVVVPVNWTNSTEHTVKVTIQPESGEPKASEAKGKAPDKGGYWNAEWPYFHSLVVSEHTGLVRHGEPVHAAIGLFADEIAKPENELRVVTYDPTQPNAGPDGYVMVPFQIYKVTVWRDKALLNRDERDAETKEPVHRFDATTTVELVLLADVQPYESKVYQILYGNPKAEPLPAAQTDLKVTPGEGMSQTIENTGYRYFLSKNSGAVEQVTVLGKGEPVLLEHKLETNGAVHWNPGFYSPPKPWVHASDWENPHFAQITGPLMHRTERYAPLPHIEDVPASVSYEFYAGQPYTLMTSLMEVENDHFVQALRDGEVVFNHAVLNEFVWMDPDGKLQSLDIEPSRKHPIHALEIDPKTPWMAFISRSGKVGFAGINLAFECGNRYAEMPSVAQPYFYVQNGPWVYWARPIVYPFGGKNFTRMMPVRKGSFYFERMAWLPFRFDDGPDSFASVKETAMKLMNPLLSTEWMPTNPRTPDKWVMPILTMPFNEGVAGAVSAHKTAPGEEGKKKE